MRVLELMDLARFQISHFGNPRLERSIEKGPACLTQYALYATKKLPTCISGRASALGLAFEEFYGTQKAPSFFREGPAARKNCSSRDSWRANPQAAMERSSWVVGRSSDFDLGVWTFGVVGRGFRVLNLSSFGVRVRFWC